MCHFCTCSAAERSAGFVVAHWGHKAMRGPKGHTIVVGKIVWKFGIMLPKSWMSQWMIVWTDGYVEEPSVG